MTTTKLTVADPQALLPTSCPGGVIVVSPRDPREIEPSLVDRYRAARAKLEQAQKFSPSPPGTLSPTEMDFLGDLRMRAVDLAEHVLWRADALVTADASLLGHLRSIIHGSIYSLGNPMSGLGGNTVVQEVLRSLREAETLLDREDVT